MVQILKFSCLTALFVLMSLLGFTQIQVLDNNSWAYSPLEMLLIQYADSNNIEIVARALKNGANPNATTIDSISSLMYAVQNGNYYMVSLLLGYGANPNIKPYNGTTALHAAAILGLDSIAVLLVNSKAKINAKNYIGLTPLHYSVWNGYPYLSDLLVQMGATVDEVDDYGNTPLILAIYNGTNGCAQALLDNGANPNKGDSKGTTPLMIAAQFNDTLQIKYLLKYGAEIKQKDKYGFDALAYAIESRAVDATELISSYKQFNTDLTQNYTQLAAQTHNSQLKGIVEKFGLNEKTKLSIGNTHWGIETIMANHIFMWGPCFGISENLTRIRLNMHYLFKCYNMTTLDERNMQLYQFREKRQILGINLSQTKKVFDLNESIHFGFYYGIGTDIIFRNYKATPNDPATKLYFNAKAGIYRRTEIGEIQLGWDYSSLKTIDVSPHRFGITVMFIIPNESKSVRTKNIDYVY